MNPIRSLLSRSLLLTVVVLLAGSCSRSDPAGPGRGSSPALGDKKLTVVVAVVDSLMPHEITTTTPNLNALKAAGTFYNESRSVFAAETIPNHVAMMTGVYPARNGIPANNFFDFSTAPPAARDLSLPEELTANTLFTWINRQCVTSGINPDIRTGATLSKKYLFEIFEGDAANPGRANDNPNVFNVQPDSYWNPQDDAAYIGSPDEHTPDLPTMTQALKQLPEVDFLFINLGDVDRSAHAGGEGFRSSVLPQTDSHVGDLVTALQDTGRWENTVMFVVSDHGMDYSAPGPATVISTQSTLNALGSCFKPMTAVASGGTNGVFVTDPAATADEKHAAVRAARACLLGGTPCADLCAGASRPANAANIAHAWYTVNNPLDPAGNMPDGIASRHPNFGDLVLAAGPGGKFAEPSPSSASGQIPGNHGHVITLRNTFLITGGSPWIKPAQVIGAPTTSPPAMDRLPEQSENVDIAPTVAWLLGLNIQPGEFPDGQGGFDGRILKEAFAQFTANANAASPTVCGRFD